MDELTSSFSKLNTSTSKRSKNIIIFGLPESESKSDFEMLDELLNALFQGPHFLYIVSFNRLKSRDPDKHKPLMVTFSTQNECENVLRLARLRKIKDVFFQKDLSKTSRLEIKQILLECKERNLNNTDKNFRYCIGKNWLFIKSE